MSKAFFPTLILALSLIGFISPDGFATQPLSASHINRIQKSKQDRPAPPWIKLAPKGAEFSILFPTAPEENVDSFQQDSITLPVHGYALSLGEVMYFAMSIGDFVENPISSELIDLFFSNAHKIILEYTEKDGKKALPQSSINERLLWVVIRDANMNQIVGLTRQLVRGVAG